VSQSAHGELFAGFAQPNPEFSPVPIWWWSGGKVELDRLCWQLDRLAEQGVYNAVVLNLAPTGPLYGALADDPPLFSDAWWQLWEGLCAHARTRGFRLWFYDQIGFSGASLQGRIVLAEPELAGASLERVTADVDGPAELTCPVAGTPIGACALPIDESGAVTGPPVPIPVIDGKAEWTGGTEAASGRHRIMLAYSLRQGFDYMSRDACARLFDIVHGAFERHLASFFGDVIVGSFQDELPSLPMWSPAVPAEFERRKGYSIEPAIAALWEDWGLESVRVRADFQRVRGALAEEAFFQPLFEWHEKHGLTFGVDQQSPSRTGEPLAGTWQYADYMRTHRWFSAPGSDHHGDAKIHSSLAHHYGRPRTWIESFHSSGWGGTLEETFDWLVPWLLAGATLYDPHAVYYSTHGGWWEWAPPSTCWRQPYWRHYKHFADTVSRLSWLLTRGDHVCDVGILFPSATIQACTLVKGHLPEAKRANDTYNTLIGRMVWYNAKPGVFNRADLDFDVLDDDTTANAIVDDAALRTSAETYRAVVLPSARFLEPETARKLADFGENGGLLVVVGDRPEQVTDPSDEAGVQAIRRLRALLDSGSAMHVTDPEAVPAALERLGLLHRLARLEGPLLHRKVGARQVALVPAAPLGSATKNPIISDTGHWYYDVYQNGYDFDPARYRAKTTIRLTGAATNVELWDPLTGLTKPAVTRPVDGDTEVEVDFDSVPVAVLVWTEGGSADTVSSTVESRKAVTWKEIPLDAGWASGIVPTTDNRYGDLALPAHEGPLPVQQWRMRHRIDGTDDWSEVVAGYGTFGWIREPGAADWQPLRYSLSRGIQADPVQASGLGPKGRVPDEFWHVQSVKKGQAVSLRTALPYAGEGPVTLAIGTNGGLAARWNGVDLPADPGGYLRFYDVTPDASGLNQLELDVTAEKNGILRGYWALTTDPAAFARPVWLEPGDESSVGSTLSIGNGFELEALPQQGILQLGTDGPATLLVNGIEIGTQGAFEPYGSQNRVLPYDITTVLRQGTNTIEVRLTDVGHALAAFVDARFTNADGTSTSVVTDPSWTFERNGVAITTVVRRSQQYDARWSQLVARPHALPASRWIDPEAVEGGVVELVPEARPGTDKAAEWFRLAVPPGAVSATLPVAVDSFQVWLGDDEIAVPAGERTVALADPHGEGRVLTVRLQPADGRTEGALWDGPATFECGEGRLSPGPWDQAGLASYSGGVTYRKDVTLGESVGQVALDLGAVRGTAEVSVNGQPIGVRIWSPYRFDISEAMRPGANTIEVTVFNTLGPYLNDASPTRYVFAGQQLSGMLGPVRLLAQEA
jgi:hypothetical protein